MKVKKTAILTTLVSPVMSTALFRDARFYILRYFHRCSEVLPILLLLRCAG